MDDNILYSIFQNQSKSTESFIPILLALGCFLGLLVVLDPYITKIISHSIPLVISGVNIIEFFPYEFSFLFLLLIISLYLLIASLPKIFEHKELFFIILFLFAFQSSALFTISFVDGSDIIIGTFLLIWLIIVLHAREEYCFAKTPINFLNLLFFFSILLSSTNEFSSIIFIRLLKSVALFFILVNFLYKKELVIIFVKWVIVVTILSAIIGILQEIVYLYTKVPVVGFVPEDRIFFEQTAIGWLLRIPAFMGCYKLFAMLLSFSLIVIVNMLLYPSPLVRSKKEKIFLYFALLLMFCALILTFSRDAMLGTCIALVISVYLKWRYYLIHFIVILALLFVLGHFCGFFDSFYKGGVSFIHAKAAELGEDRIQLDREGIEGFLHGPFLIGRGAFEGVKYTSHVEGWPAHNAFILAADEIGIFGLLVYLSLFIFAIYRLIFINLSAKELQDKVISKGLLCAFIAYCIILQFHAGYIETLLWLYLGIIESMALIILSKQYRRTAQCHA